MLPSTLGEPDPAGDGHGEEPRRFPGEDEEGVPSSERRLHTWTGLPDLRNRRRNAVKAFTELATPSWILQYVQDRNSEEDFWDYNRDIGVMRRHHSVRRTELFGHDPLDPNWENSPFPRRSLSPWRRSTLLFYNGDIIHLIDCWNYREPLDQIRPSICDQGWWGFTDFGLIGGEDISIPAPFAEKQVWNTADAELWINDHEEEEEEELNEDGDDPEAGGDGPEEEGNPGPGEDDAIAGLSTETGSGAMIEPEGEPEAYEGSRKRKTVEDHPGQGH